MTAITTATIAISLVSLAISAYAILNTRRRNRR